MSRRVALGSDHAAFEAKEEIKRVLEQEMGATVIDAGPASPERCDYPDFAFTVAKKVAAGEVDCGVLLCGSGVGMSMAANRIKGVRAALVTSEELAELSRRHNNANIICMGARTTPMEMMKRYLRIWWNEPYEGGRHDGRVALMDSEGSEA